MLNDGCEKKDIERGKTTEMIIPEKFWDDINLRYDTIWKRTVYISVLNQSNIILAMITNYDLDAGLRRWFKK